MRRATVIGVVFVLAAGLFVWFPRTETPAVPDPVVLRRPATADGERRLVVEPEPGFAVLPQPITSSPLDEPTPGTSPGGSAEPDEENSTVSPDATADSFDDEDGTDDSPDSADSPDD